MKSPLRLLLPLLLLAGGAFTVALGGFYASTADNLRREALLRQRLHARAVAEPYLAALNAAEALGNAVAALVGPGQERAEVENILRELLEVTPCEDVRGVGVWLWLETPGGRPLTLYAYREGKGGQVRVEERSPLSVPPGGQPSWVEQVRAANGAPVFLPPSRVNDDTHRVYALGVHDAHGQVVGAVGVDLGLKALAGALDETHLPGKQVAYVVAPPGVLLLHPLKPQVEQSARNPAAGATAKDVRRYHEARYGGVWQEVKLSLKNTGWEVHLATDPSVLFGNLRRFQFAVVLLGLTFWAVLLSVPLVVHHGVRVRMLARALDERRRIHAMLERNEHRLREVLETSLDAVVATDAAGRVICWNQQAERTFGFPRDEVLGRPLLDMWEAPGLEGDELRRLVEQHEGGPRRERLALTLRRRSGETFPAELAATCVHTHGTPACYLFLADVTQRVEMERLKEEFVRVAAHELKTPVAIMKTNAQLALRLPSSEPPTARRALEAINRGADRIDRIVRELLDVSQLQLGRLQLREEPVDLSALVEESARQALARHPGRAVDVTPGPPLVVRGDRQRLAQVLAVLLDNALRYSAPPGRVEVHLQGREGSVEVCVRDDGIGIPPGKQDHLFERFYRVHSGTPHDRGGLGVGLYIARQIITQHGGHMRVRSEEGQGSLFCFSLPFAWQQAHAGDAQL